MDLKRLAEAMKRRGIGVYWNPSLNVMYQDLGYYAEDVWAYDGTGDCPELAFALLDDMEKAGIVWNDFVKRECGDYSLDSKSGYYDAERDYFKRTYGATRTEAIVNAYLAADAAGLLDEGVKA